MQRAGACSRQEFDRRSLQHFAVASVGLAIRADQDAWAAAPCWPARHLSLAAEIDRRESPLDGH